jgi:hypothetical protein
MRRHNCSVAAVSAAIALSFVSFAATVGSAEPAADGAHWADEAFRALEAGDIIARGEYPRADYNGDGSLSFLFDMRGSGSLILQIGDIVEVFFRDADSHVAEGVIITGAARGESDAQPPASEGGGQM